MAEGLRVVVVGMIDGGVASRSVRVVLAVEEGARKGRIVAYLEALLEHTDRRRDIVFVLEVAGRMVVMVVEIVVCRWKRNLMVD